MTVKSHISILFISFFPLALAAQVCMPSVTAYNGLAVYVHPVDTDGDGMTDLAGAVLRMSDLIARADDHCNAGPLRFGIRKPGTGTGFPSDTTLLYTCNELGAQPVELWVRNSKGMTHFVETYILVEENTGECSTHTPRSTSCGTDVILPEIYTYSGLCGTVRADGLLTVPVSALVQKVYDNCGGPYEYRLRKAATGTGPPADSVVVFDCNELGTQLLEVWAGDGAGNWGYCETYVQVQDPDLFCDAGAPPPPAGGCSPDQTPPELLAHDGFAQALLWGSNGPSLRVHAENFIRLGRDQCADSLSYRISKATGAPGPEPPKDAAASVRFSCDELGTQFVWIWLRDSAGNWTKTRSYVLVQDNTDACGQKPGFKRVVVPEFKQKTMARPPR